MTPCWLLVFTLLTGVDTVEVRRAPRDPWFAADKARHGALAFALQGASYASLRGVAGHDASLVASAAFTLGLGILKELHDRGGTGFSLRDLAWDVAGIAAAAALVSHRPQH